MNALSFYLHPVAWSLFEGYSVFIFSNGITLQTRALTEKKLNNSLLAQQQNCIFIGLV